MIREEFEQRINEFEGILQKVASDIAGGILVERLPPSELLTKTEGYVTRLGNLASASEELMLILKPERAYTIRSACKKLTQTLATFRDILLQNTSDPVANSRLAFEQLRKAVTDGSDFLFLMREVRENPSPLIDSILSYQKASQAKSSVISIQAKEDIQPLVKYILGRVDDFRAVLIALEKKLDEMKQIMRELQAESLKILSGESASPSKTDGNALEKKQLSLSNFKAETSDGGK